MELALVQMRVDSGQVEENLRRAEGWIAKAAASGADLVVLPEAMDAGWAQPEARQGATEIPGGSTVTRLQRAAAAHRLLVCSGLTERDGDRVFNAAVLIGRCGEILLRHRKIHELDFARQVYATGSGLGVRATELGVIGMMICADAFVPGRVISRCLGNMGAQLIVSPCAWAVPRDHDNEAEPYGRIWRDSYGPVAREFGLWIAGVSNVGTIGGGAWAGRKCIGCSLLVGPDGETRASGPYGEDAETMIRAEVNLP